MSRILIAAFGLTVLLGAATAARAVPVYDFSPVTAEMQIFVQTYQLDGASLRINKHGNMVYRRAFGGYIPSTRVPIASASKWLSALTLARLVDKGQMRWTDTVGQYFPDVQAAKRPITLAQLFSHTSALPGGDDSCMSNPLFTLSSCANSILQEPLIGEPGKVFSYGGNSMQVAGRMAEVATGKAWDDIFIDEMVTPLGMNATDFAAMSTAPGYVRKANPRIAGGVRSTLEDYGRVVDMVLAHGCLDNTFTQYCLPNRRFLSAATIDWMAIDRTVGAVIVYRPPTATVHGLGYGIGQWVDPSLSLYVSSPGAFGFMPWVDHANHVAGVLLVQDSNSRLASDINDIRAMVNAVTAEGRGRRVRPVQPAIPAAQSAVKTKPVLRGDAPRVRVPEKR